MIIIENKQKKSLMLLVSIVLLLFVQIISYSPYSVAVETSDALITEDWMAVTKGDFVDSSPDPRENQVWITLGGKDLLSFENLGISNTKTTDEILVYEASAIFGFEMTLHTSATFDDVFPNLKDVENLERIIKTPFFGVGFKRLYPPAIWTNVYDVGYIDLNLGEKVDHDYTGSVPLTVNFKTWTGKQPLNVNGVEISTPYYDADISNVKTINIRDGEVGGYEDVFVDSTGLIEGIVDYTTSEDTPADTLDTLEWLENHNIGWTGNDETETIGIQQPVHNPLWDDYDNAYPAIVKDFSFDVGARIRPEVYKYENDIEFRKAAIVFEQGILGDWLPPTVVLQPSTEIVKRTVGVHVNNQFIHWDFTVDMIIYATVQNSAELSQSILEDPYLKIGDFIWDTGFTGTREVSVLVPENPEINWMIIAIIVIVIGVGLYFVYKIFIDKKDAVTINIMGNRSQTNREI